MTADPIDVLHALPRYAGRADEGYKPGLDRMQALLDALKVDVDTLPTIHVAGTNGKGSTAAMIAAIAQAAGYTVGLHTSPHLWSVTERMRINGAPVSEAMLREDVLRAQAAFERIQPSFFEATVALSLQHFARQQVDLAVVEVGLGGRLDATNVVQSQVAVITSIGLDHTALLGDTHAAIAREKGGIMRAGRPLVVGPLPSAAQETLANQARECGAMLYDTPTGTRWREAPSTGRTLITPRGCYSVEALDFPGTHQQANAACAVRALELHPHLTIGPEAVTRGLQGTRAYTGLHGRMEQIATHPPIWVDVAHNAEGLAAACATLPRCPGRCIVALGVMRDKPLAPLLDVLATTPMCTLWPVTLETERAYEGALIQQAAADRGWQVAPPRSLSDHIREYEVTASPEDMLFVTGSHYTVAAVPPHVRPG